MRRRQVTAIWAQEKTLLDTTPAAMWPHIRPTGTGCRLHGNACTGNSQDHLQSHLRWSGQTALLRSISRVGPVVAPVFIAARPELGRLCSHQLAALVDIASLKDRGQPRGQHYIWGGRTSMRKILCMATMSAICAFYTRLCDKGNPKKAALVAAIRKLLTVLNAVGRDQVPWQTELWSTAFPSHPTPQIPKSAMTTCKLLVHCQRHPDIPPPPSL